MTQLGRYQLISKLASGGMAEVFLSRAAGPGDFEKTLVLKRILPHLAEDPAFVQMFLSEARIAARLEHPNIVQIFDFGQADGTYYLAMEYIDGLNLRALMKKARQAQRLLPVALCARIITLASEGLAYAHDRVDSVTGEPLHLIHRDISADNVMLSRQGAVKVVDFGIAKVTDQNQRTATGVVKGKLAYMAPEQLHGLVLDRRTDVYALGVVLYELLTGQRPFDARTEASLMQAIVYQPPIPASERRPGLPASLQRILDRALAKEREQRYPDCRALQADLERFILSTGEPVGAWQLAQLIEGLLGVQLPSFSGFTPVSAEEPDEPGPVPTRTAPASTSGTGENARPTESLSELAEPELPEASIPPRRVPFRPTSRWKPVAMAVGCVLLGGLSSLAFLSWYPASRPVSQVAALPSTPAPQPSPPGPLEPVVATAPTPAPVNPAPTPPPVPGGVQEVPPTERAAPRPAEPTIPTEEPAAPTKTRPARSGTALAAQGTVDFRVRPYATVFINGRSLGQTPLAPIRLPAGRYTVTLINKEINKVATRQLEVLAGQPTIFKYDLLNESNRGSN